MSKWWIQKPAKYLSWPLKLFEQPILRIYGNKPPIQSPVFIIGAPRTGSTILYQILTNYFDLLYPDNLVDLFRRNMFIGFWISHHIYNDKPHNCYRSRFGNTEQCGLHAPNEFGQFWYRWLPKHKHFIEADEVSASALLQMKLNLTAVLSYFEKPLLFKNLNMGQRLRMLAQILPNSKIIWIKRDPLLTAQSIYNAKKRLKLKPNEWWSVMPPNYNELKNLDACEQIIKQIFFIERQIFLDKKLFPEKQLLTIEYESLSSNLNDLLDKIRRFIHPDLNYRKMYDPVKFNTRNKNQIEDSVVSKFKYWISKMNWEKYEFQ